MNSQLQAEEVEALRAIYEDTFSSQSEGVYKVCVCSEGLRVEMMLMFPVDYPSTSPPLYELRYAPWIKSSDLAYIDSSLHQIYNESSGGVVVYEWVEWLRQWLSERTTSNNDPEPRHDVEGPQALAQEQLSVEETHSQLVLAQCPDILHGQPLTDRKSTFQAHLARVSSTDELETVIAVLKQNKKIATATHNIMAYRIYHEGRDTYQQDCDDDGEAAAGGRLLHLLQIMDVRDVVVVVTRWYGGVLLGADRFKHINNVARTIIQESGRGLEHKIPTSRSAKDKKHFSKSKGGKNR
ncbi:protein IMPACT-A-like isoform X2 [Halichondria panicea]|uniref:protein IMPACT-A-like isoform X2 n=1 Tax=Halichondria panicea TaxID=6063 RepID=UPI00312B72AE